MAEINLLDITYFEDIPINLEEGTEYLGLDYDESSIEKSDCENNFTDEDLIHLLEQEDK